METEVNKELLDILKTLKCEYIIKYKINKYANSNFKDKEVQNEMLNYNAKLIAKKHIYDLKRSLIMLMKLISSANRCFCNNDVKMCMRMKTLKLRGDLLYAFIKKYDTIVIDQYNVNTFFTDMDEMKEKIINAHMTND